MVDTSPYIMDAPVDNYPEQVFFHELNADKNKNTFCALVNAEGNLAIKLSFPGMNCLILHSGKVSVPVTML